MSNVAHDYSKICLKLFSVNLLKIHAELFTEERYVTEISGYIVTLIDWDDKEIKQGGK
jgi:hypothetical protein